MQIWILVAVSIVIYPKLTGRVPLQIKTVPTELTIASVKELFLQISLAPTNGPASLDTVNAAEIREL